jgi:NADH:ubiquinone oxidoreductase subunit E
MSSTAHAPNPAHVQPADLTIERVRERMARFQPRIDELLRRFPVKRAALLPVLWLVQEEFGWVPRVAIAWAAEISAVSPVHAFGVVEFYTMYRQVPMGRFLIQVCQTMCCHIQGSEALTEHLEKTLGIHAGETTEDGLFSLLRVECLALCGTGPGVMINDQAIGPVPHALGQSGLRESHLDQPEFHPTPAIMDAWIAFLRDDAAKNPQAQQQHDAMGDLVLNTKGHPGGCGATAAVLPSDYAPAAPALKVAAKSDGEAIAITWLNDPGCAKAVVERSDDGGATWREVSSVSPKDQKASDRLEWGRTAQYRVIAHEKTRAARPSAAVSVTAAPAPAKA